MLCTVQNNIIIKKPHESLQFFLLLHFILLPPAIIQRLKLGIHAQIYIYVKKNIFYLNFYVKKTPKLTDPHIYTSNVYVDISSAALLFSDIKGGSHQNTQNSDQLLMNRGVHTYQKSHLYLYFSFMLFTLKKKKKKKLLGFFNEYRAELFIVSFICSEFSLSYTGRKTNNLYFSRWRLNS